MRRAKWMAVVLLLLALLPLVAQAEGPYTARVQAYDEDNMGNVRVAMRAEPFGSAVVMFRVYKTVPVEVLGNGGGGFSKIRLGDVTGYMMTKFLEAGPGGALPIDVPMGYVDVRGGGTLNVHSRPDADSPVVHVIENKSSVEVLADGRQWHYVREGEDTPCGFVLADEITYAGGFRFATAQSRMTLYTWPEEGSAVLDTFSSGTDVRLLFSPDVRDGWYKVRVGDRSGFVKTEDLTFGGY